eukprot:CAMPEP_0116025724 /NCGR_PEP_ID=MMETSP0321-20121206/13273_1 /TAXON_ID=163516 /ORGANISM="Leptocylindrus danicus var. danicus, Strain B650" /LENGTH=238 /DNA_ID=CAMNT_0003498081 /DNA_START=124 /DNA_END=840 /DNA_ORIENTATION=+
MAASPKVAMILAGSGVYDGSETTEAVAAIVQLSKHGCDTHMFAPNEDQMHVVNHLTGEEMPNEKRNVLVESARIARGKVKPATELNPADYDALILPGGFGAAKNLCNFATTLGAGKGTPEDMVVQPSIAKIVTDFNTQKKVIGACCIAPVILAKVLPGVNVTMGCSSGDDFPFAGATGAVEALGGTHEETQAPCKDVCIDHDKLVVTSAAYMYDGKPHEVFESVCAMVDAVVDLAKQN